MAAIRKDSTKAIIRASTGRGVRLALALALIGANQPAWSEPDKTEKSNSVNQSAPRSELLGGLYDQLSKADDRQNADFLTSTIEQLWLQSGSATVDVLMSRAILMVQDKEFDIALEILDTVVEIAPEFSEGWNQRATVHFLKRDFQDSLNDLRRVLALDPRHFKAVNGLGLILQELGQKQSALEAYRRALLLNPFLVETKRAIKELEREVEGQGI